MVKVGFRALRTFPELFLGSNGGPVKGCGAVAGGVPDVGEGDWDQVQHCAHGGAMDALDTINKPKGQECSGGRGGVRMIKIRWDLFCGERK